MIGGALAALFTHASLMTFDAFSTGAAAIAAMYVLFAYQCLEMRQ
jgi:hypothetical protein